MRKPLVFLLLLFLCACSLPALADDSLSLPDGRQLRLEPLHLGDQYQVESANMESIFLLNLYENDALFQQLYFTTQENRQEGPFIKAQDLNFDGYPDLDIIYQLGASNSWHIFFFYDQDTGKYEPWQYSYMWLSNYTLDPENGYLINYVHDSAVTGTKEIYRWEEKTLQPVRSAHIRHDEYDYDTVHLEITYYGDGPAKRETVHYRSLDLMSASDEEILSMHQEMDERLFKDLK